MAFSLQIPNENSKLGKLLQEAHKFTVLAPLRWKGRELEYFYLFPEDRVHERGEYVPADLQVLTEEPWISKWKDETRGMSLMEKVQTREVQEKTEKFPNIVISM